MRAWMGATVSLAAVVMIVHETMRSPLPPSPVAPSARHDSHSPAKASGFPSLAATYQGCLGAPAASTCHS